MKRRFWVVILTASILGCGSGDDIEVYTVEKPPRLPAGHPRVDQGAPEAGRPTAQLSIEAPAGWVEKAASGGRLASFDVPGPAGTADASVTVMAGEGGGLANNLNRWRQQMGLGALSEPELRKTLQPIALAGSQAFLVRLEGTYTGMGGGEPTPGSAMLAVAGMTPHGAVFVKLVGPMATVDEQEEAFRGLIQSISFEKPAAPAEAQGGGLLVVAPRGWVEKAKSLGRHASYDAPGPDGPADVSVTILGGDGGGLTDNINRWRQQMALPTLAERDLQKTLERVDLGGHEAFLTKLQGSYTGMGGGEPKPGWAMLAVVSVSDHHGAVFVKMVGPASTVDAQEAAFRDFVASLAFAGH